MKTFHFWVLLFLTNIIFNTNSQAQSSWGNSIPVSSTIICFTYDQAGNRILRQVCVNGQEERRGTFEEKIELNGFSIYPNPVAENLHIDFDEDEVERTFSILNLDGSVIESGTLYSKNQINFSSYSPGIYILTFKYQERVENLRIVKN